MNISSYKFHPKKSGGKESNQKNDNNGDDSCILKKRFITDKITWKTFNINSKDAEEENENDFLFIEKNLFHKDKYRIVLKKLNKVCSDVSFFNVYIISEEDTLKNIEIEFKLLKKHLETNLKKFEVEKIKIELKHVKNIIEGVKIKLQNDEVKKLTKISSKNIKDSKKIDKKTTKESRDSILLDSDSDIDEVEIPDSDDDEEDDDEEDEVEDSDSDDDNDNSKNQKVTSINNAIKKISCYKKNIVFFEKTKDTYEKRGKKFVGKKAQKYTLFNSINQSKKRMEKDEKLIENFFFIFKKKIRDLDSEKKRIYDAISKDFERLKKKKKKIMNTKDMNDIMLESQLYTSENSYIRKRIKKAKNKKGTVNHGKGGQQQQQQQHRLLLTMNQEVTINVEKKIAEETNQDLSSMTTDMNETLDMMNDIKILAEGQQDYIDDIESKVQSSNDNVEKGRLQIRKARDMQKAGRGAAKKVVGGAAKGIVRGIANILN